MIANSADCGSLYMIANSADYGSLLVFAVPGNRLAHNHRNSSGLARSHKMLFQQCRLAR
jgi:hypothetical protein